MFSIDQQPQRSRFEEYGSSSINSDQDWAYRQGGRRIPYPSCTASWRWYKTCSEPVGDRREIFPFPNLVIEVAHSNKSQPKLKTELRNWISDDTSVQVAIGIKIFGPRVNGITSVLVLALVYQRDCPLNQEQAVEFGTNVGDAAGLALTIRLADLYHGVAFPAGVNAAATVAVDLADVRDAIARYL
jgi:hypothetical protein